MSKRKRPYKPGEKGHPLMVSLDVHERVKVTAARLRIPMRMLVDGLVVAKLVEHVQALEKEGA